MFCSWCNYTQVKVSNELLVLSPRTPARTSPTGYGHLAQCSPLQNWGMFYPPGVCAARMCRLGSPNPQDNHCPPAQSPGDTWGWDPLR